MAKKNQSDSLTYLQLPLPSGTKYQKTVKRSWNGYNKRQVIDTGMLSMEKNISSAQAPYLVPSQERVAFTDYYEHPVGLFGFDTFLIVIYRDNDALKLDYITFSDSGGIGNVYTGVLKSEGADTQDDYPRCIVQFNVYDTPTDPVSGKYIKKLLIFPDKKSMDYDITKSGFEINDMDVLVKNYTNDKKSEDGTYPPPDTSSHNYYYRNTYNNDVYRWVDDASNSENSGWKVSVPPAMPDIKYAAVHLSRLFGVSGDRVYVSGYNDYTNWNLDTVDEYNASNAWCSPAQSNTKAGGDFTGIANYSGHIVLFKRDFMHEIYNTKNPFRIQDIYAEGAIDARSVLEVDGTLFFVSEDDIKVYTGSDPRIVGHELGVGKFLEAVSGTDGRRYYLYCEDEKADKHIFVYDTRYGYWAEEEVSCKVINFAHTKYGMFMLGADGVVYKIDSGTYRHTWSFETDLFTNGTVDIKHIKKIQMLSHIGEGARIRVYMLYDDEVFDENTSHLVYESNTYGRKPIRVKPRQTASYGMKLHVEGYGYVMLYEMELFLNAGGDLYV